MCTCYPIINRVSELKVHIELTRFVQPEKIEIDANERAVNEKSQYCFFVCTTFDSFLNDFSVSKTGSYLLTLLTFPYFQGFPPLKILYMYPFPLFLPLWDNYKGKFIIQLFNRCLPLYQEVLRKSALLPL